MLLKRLESLQHWSASSGEQPAEEYRRGDLRVSSVGQQAWMGSRELPLTTAEYRLLHVLARASGRSVPPEELLNRIWAGGRTDADRVVPILIHRLRQKIEADPAAPKYLLGQLGEGYSLGLGPATGST